MKVDNKIIAIIGLGYVGLPLAVEFSKKYSVIGFDINKQRIDELLNGVDSSLEVSHEELSQTQSIRFTLNKRDLKKANIYIVTVPTPIDQYNKPDLKPLLNASELVGSVIKKGDIVIFESTVYPGATEEECIPVIEKKSGLTYNKDFFAGYSPERINPGDKVNRLTNILKVTSGSTPAVADIVNNLYSSVITAGTYKAPSIKVAEAAKVIENTQRDVNIALMNELAVIFDRLDIDTHEVLKAARTKWNFLSFEPGLVGGHCIGVDPYYLLHKAKSIGYIPDVIQSSRKINSGIPKYLADKLVKKLIKENYDLSNVNVLVLGATFKEDCPDMRNSKVVDLVRELKEYSLKVDCYDPYVKSNNDIKLIDIDCMVENLYDVIIIAVKHKIFIDKDISWFKKFGKANSIIFDIKNIFEESELKF